MNTIIELCMLNRGAGNARQAGNNNGFGDYYDSLACLAFACACVIMSIFAGVSRFTEDPGVRSLSCALSVTCAIGIIAIFIPGAERLFIPRAERPVGFAARIWSPENLGNKGGFLLEATFLYMAAAFFLSGSYATHDHRTHAVCIIFASVASGVSVYRICGLMSLMDARDQHDLEIRRWNANAARTAMPGVNRPVNTGHNVARPTGAAEQQDADRDVEMPMGTENAADRGVELQAGALEQNADRDVEMPMGTEQIACSGYDAESDALRTQTSGSHEQCDTPANPPGIELRQVRSATPTNSDHQRQPIAYS